MKIPLFKEEVISEISGYAKEIFEKKDKSKCEEIERIIQNAFKEKKVR